MDGIQKILEEKESPDGVQNRNQNYLKENENSFLNQINEKSNKFSQILKEEKCFGAIEEKESKMNSIISLIAISSILKMFLSPFKELKSLSVIGINPESLKWGFILLSLSIIASLSFYLIRKVESFSLKFISIVLFGSVSLFSIFLKIEGFVFRSFCFMAILIFAFKLYSFLIGTPRTNQNQENQKESKECDDFGYFTSFILSPAIYFRSDYPKKEKRNIKKLLELVCKAAIYGMAMCFLFHNVALPLLKLYLNSSTKIELFENFLMLNIAVIILFNLFFFVIFKYTFAMLNEVSGLEIVVYKDWWNAKDSSEFWRYWNVPMHVFIKEMIYIPLLKKKVNSHLCRISCLFFSGIFHELVVSLALKKFSGWFFLAMMLQDPLLYVTYNFRMYFPEYSNYFFLISFCMIGQTVGFILLFKGMAMTV